MHSTLITAISNLHELPTNQILIKNVTRFFLLLISMLMVQTPVTHVAKISPTV